MKKILIVLICFILFTISGCQSKSALDPHNPITVRLWNYYSAKQLESFNELVKEFNQTVGKEKGVIIEATSFGSVNELGESVMDAVNKKVGAKDVPHVFAAYADTAYQIDKLGLVENIKPYFSSEDLDQYIQGYIEEGYFNNHDELKIFPIAKSTEVMMINKTDFDKFSKATSTSLDELLTIEGVTKVSKKYYEYTDSLTPKKNDGKAFFGRDALANYIIIGLKQFGHDIVSMKDGKTVLDFDKQTVKKLWDHYYVPYVRGYYSSKGRFRSDDIKIGNIVSCVGSSSGATFFPTQVITSDDNSYPIDVEVIKAPLFKDGDNYAVQQGAGMVVTKSDKAHVEGSVEFLKWFTQDEQDISFSIDSGYLPVTKEANQKEKIEKSLSNKSEVIKKVIHESVETVNTSQLYVSKTFDRASDLRSQLEKIMQTKAKNDRSEVEKALNQNQEYETVMSKYDNDENFENWYKETYQVLKDIVG